MTFGDTVWPEGDGVTEGYITVKLSAPYSEDIPLAFRLYQPVDTNDWWASIRLGCSAPCKLAAGQTEAKVPLIITGNASYQSIAREWQASLFSGSVYDGTLVNISLTEDDPVPVVTLDDVTVTEGSSGVTWLAVTLTASSPATGSVAWRTIAETAEEGPDYWPGTFHFLDMQQPIRFRNTDTVTIGFGINGDTQHEGTETFLLQLYDAHDLQLGRTQIRVTILDDDPEAPPTPLVTVEDISVVETNGGTVNATLTFSAPSPLTGSLDWEAVDNGANAADHDYQAGNGTIQFNNSSTATLVVPVYGDLKVESDEMVLVRFSNPVNLRLDRSSATITILNDDVTDLPPLHSIVFSPSALSLFAGESAAVEATMANSSTAGESALVSLLSTTGAVSVSPTVEVPGTLTITAMTPGIAEVQCDGAEIECANVAVVVFSPMIAGLSPARAATTGGTEVTLRGAGLSNGCSVAFGGVPATNERLIDQQTIVALAPPHAPGLVSVTMTCGAVPLVLPNAVDYVAAGRQRSVRH